MSGSAPSILHLTRDYPPPHAGGISTAVAGLVRALAPHVVPQVVSYDHFRANAQHEGVTDSHVLRANRETEAPHVLSWLASNPTAKPRWVHVHDPLLWELGERLARTLAVPTAYTVHVHHAHNNALRAIDATQSSRAEALAMTQADRVTVPSQHTARHVHRVYARQCEVLGWGVDAHPAHEPPGHRPHHIGTLGRFADLKGTQDFLDAIQPIIKSQHCSIAVAGGLAANPKKQRRWHQRITEQCIYANPSSQLTLLPWLSTHDARSFLAKCHAVVVPSWNETFGLVAAEALQAGCHVVATNVGAHPEFAQHVPKTQLRLVPPRDVKALSAAIEDTVASELPAPAPSWDSRSWEHAVRGWLEFFALGQVGKAVFH